MNKVKLPKRKIHKTPRLLMADAYTLGSNEFESDAAKQKSIYYITFRKFLQSIDPILYSGQDTRLLFYGLSRILDYLFYEPVTHQEIDETKEFVQNLEVSSDGLHEYSFPEQIWRDVVNNYNGRPPIKVRALREGSVFYPNEPTIVIESMVESMGVLAAWFESKLLMVWSSTEMLTQLEHWLMYCKSMVTKVLGPDTDEDTIDFTARLMLHNFGDRAGICPQESEWLAETALLTFPGTDTLSGAYQAWMNSDKTPGTVVTVKALAHRNIQSYELEEDCFRALYDKTRPNGISSYVADCYSFYDAVEQKLLPLALESKSTGSGKVVVARPDSGIAVEQVTWLCRLAQKHDLFEEREINGKKWKFGTYLKFIEGDGMTWGEMKYINDALMLQGFAPFAWGLYGVGGGLRHIARDNTSTKYALCAVGVDENPVVKFSETLGKTTLPGPFKIRRDEKSINECKTIAFLSEEGEDSLITYFDGSNIWEPFGPGYNDDFNTTKKVIKDQLKTMPLTLATDENHGYPASDLIRNTRKQLLRKYAPKKLEQNY